MARSDKSRQTLSIEQLNAIDLLVTGKSDREVAEAVGVSRQTVCGWRVYDPYFQAELNRRRKDIWGVSADKLRTLLPKAIDVLERELDGGPNSLRAALKILELASLSVSEQDIGAEDPNAIIEAEVIRQRTDPVEFMRNRPVSEEEKRATLAHLRSLAEGTS